MVNYYHQIIIIFTAFTACGDGNRDSIEECDDGNTINGDGCDSFCTIEPLYECIFNGVNVADTCHK